jgi:hypothetical protein
LKNHHRLKILHEKTEPFRRRVAKNWKKGESGKRPVCGMDSGASAKAGLVRLEHVKASGKAIRPRGVLVEREGENWL